MYGMGGNQRINTETSVEAAKLAQPRQVDRFRAEAFGQRPLDDSQAYGPLRLAIRRGRIVLVLIAAVAVIWFYGGNTPGLIAVVGAVAMALALTAFWWKQRP